MNYINFTIMYARKMCILSGLMLLMVSAQVHILVQLHLLTSLLQLSNQYTNFIGITWGC